MMTENGIFKNGTNSTRRKDGQAGGGKVTGMEILEAVEMSIATS